MSGAYCYSRNLYRDPSNSDPEPVALVTPEEGHWRSGGRTTLGWGSQASREHLEGCIMLSVQPLPPGSKTRCDQVWPIRSSYLPTGGASPQLGPIRLRSLLFRNYCLGESCPLLRGPPLSRMLEGQGVASLLVAIWSS